VAAAAHSRLAGGTDMTFTLLELCSLAPWKCEHVSTSQTVALGRLS
jgi:hypothetical protein